MKKWNENNKRREGCRGQEWVAEKARISKKRGGEGGVKMGFSVP